LLQTKSAVNEIHRTPFTGWRKKYSKASPDLSVYQQKITDFLNDKLKQNMKICPNVIESTRLSPFLVRRY